MHVKMKMTKRLEIWYKLNVQFENDAISRFQACKWHKQFKNDPKEGKQGNLLWTASQKAKLLYLNKN